MRARLRVRRFDPESNRGPWYQTYELEVPDYATVLDALIQVREELDESLALRCSCRSAICGSCAMRIGGQARLACKTRVAQLQPQDGEILVEPLGNLGVIKDLVCDLTPLWEKLQALEPWLKPKGPPPEREYLVPNEQMLALSKVMGCILCGACVSDCTVLEVDKNFLGPAALAKAYRFVGDPRDAATRERLERLSRYGGVWDCTHCFYCVEVCPKGVAPMDQIMTLRERAVAQGFTDNNGTRHHRAFIESVRRFGRLDELTLLPKSVGLFNVPELIRLAPGALRLARAGKLPFPRHSAENKEKVARIFKELEKEVKG